MFYFWWKYYLDKMNLTTNEGTLRLVRGDSGVSGADIYWEKESFSKDLSKFWLMGKDPPGDNSDNKSFKVLGMRVGVPMLVENPVSVYSKLTLTPVKNDKY